MNLCGWKCSKTFQNSPYATGFLTSSRAPFESDLKTGEIAVIITDPWQGLGLGSKMVDYMIEICKEKGLETIFGVMLQDNYRAIEIMKKMGFTIEYLDDSTVKVTLNLKEEL